MKSKKELVKIFNELEMYALLELISKHTFEEFI